MISAATIAETVADHLQDVASVLRPDVLDALLRVLDVEKSERGREVLQLLVENADLAARTGVPLCQDTGVVWVLVEVGEEAAVDLRGLRGMLDAVGLRAFAEQGLRASTVRDALSDRSNPGTNLPVLLDVVLVPGAGVSVHTMLKGAGTDNASRMMMLPPEAGEEGIAQAVLDVVREKASVACPPLVVGIGIGGSFDSVARLSKRALLRPLGTPAAEAKTAELEARLLAGINASGIGPAALCGGSGSTTALAVHIETAPCHIASLPLAINLHCHALRSRSSIL